MLEQIRSASSSFLVRALLGVMVFAFASWGIKDVLQARNNFDLVTFSSAENITDNDFLKAKHEEVSRIQKQASTNLSQEDIKNLGINKVALDRLINDRILKDIAKKYNLDISEETVIEAVKNSPIFQNEKGEFDVKLYKSVFRNGHISEADYLADIKNTIIKNSLVSILLESYKVPKALVSNIVDYMAETRNFDLIERDLKKRSNDIIHTPSESELEVFYKAHPNLFTLAEQRTIHYIEVPNSFLAKRVSITEEELRQYFDENKDSPNLHDFNKDKKQISEILTQQKTAEALLDFSKTLEDEVAAGSSLKEIATKQGLEILEAKNLSKEAAENDKLFAEMSDIIFELNEGELSYPMELKSRHELVLIELISITPARVEEFAESKEKASYLWQGEKIRGANLKMLEDVARDYTPGKALLQNGIKVSNISLSRSDTSNQKLPSELLFTIFQTDLNTNTPVFVLGDTAYFAHLKQIKIDKKKASKITLESGANIKSTIKNGVMNELIAYFIKQNNMQINYKDRVLRED